MAIRYMKLIVTAKGLACWRARIRLEKGQFKSGVKVLKRVNKSAGLRKAWQKWSERYAATKEQKEADQSNVHERLQALTNRDENSELSEAPLLHEERAELRETRSMKTLNRIEGTNHHGDHHRIMAGALATTLVVKKKKNRGAKAELHRDANHGSMEEDVRWGGDKDDDLRGDALYTLRGADHVNSVLLNGLSSNRVTVEGSRKAMIKKAVKISSIQSGIRRGPSDP